MNRGGHEIIEGTVYYYQSTFNMSMIVALLSEYNDILNKQIIGNIINGDILFLIHQIQEKQQNHVFLKVVV